MKTCSLPDCAKPRDSHGMCGMHSQRVRRYGDPNFRKHIKGDADERLWSYVNVADCWNWTGPKDVNGYGRFYEDGVLGSAHRAVWERMVGPIPEGMTLDHLCRNRPCVNPDHLRVFDPVDNTMIGYGPPAKNARKTHCKRGHEFTPDNTRIRPGNRRECRTCMRAQIKEQKRRARERRKVAA